MMKAEMHGRTARVLRTVAALLLAASSLWSACLSCVPAAEQTARAHDCCEKTRCNRAGHPEPQQPSSDCALPDAPYVQAQTPVPAPDLAPVLIPVPFAEVFHESFDTHPAAPFPAPPGSPPDLPVRHAALLI
jgi:hypothetical protein